VRRITVSVEVPAGDAAQPAGTFGRIATQLLLERIAEEATDRPCRVVLPADLNVRRSCGAPTSVEAGSSSGDF
jgi:DNA-binding LacI/PurR family transcriptional regulator